MSDQTPPREWPSLKEALVYLLLTLIPMIFLWLSPNAYPLHLNVPGGDLATSLWNQWWFDYAVSHGIWPYHTDMLFHPFGVPLTMTTFEIIDIIVTAPVRWVAGIPVAWKTALALNTWWTALAAHALARRLGADKNTSRAVAIIAAFSTYRFVHAKAISLMSTGHPIFLMWAFAGVVMKPGDLKRAALLGLGTILTAFGMVYYLLFLTVLLPAASLGAIVAGWRPDVKWIKGFLLSCGVAIAIAGPPVGALYIGGKKAEGYLGMVKEFAEFHKVRGSAEVLQFALPAWTRGALSPKQDPEAPNPRPFNALSVPQRSYDFALPITFILIAAIGFRRKRESDSDEPSWSFSRPVKGALITFCAMAVFIGLGPMIKLWTTVDPSDVPGVGMTQPASWEGIAVFSPVAWLLEKLPLWSHIRGWSRGGYFFQVAGPILLGPAFLRGLTRLKDYLSREGSLIPVAAVPLIAIGMMYAEDFRGFYTVSTRTPHPVYEVIRDMPGPGAVREFPDKGYYVTGIMMVGATIHERPLAAGYVARDLSGYDEWIESRPWRKLSWDQHGSRQLRIISPELRKRFLDSAEEDGVRFLLWRPEIAPFGETEIVPRFWVENGLARELPGGDDELRAFELLWYDGESDATSE